MGSLNRALEAERQPSPQVVPSGRTSTSTSGRKSFGDIFSLSHRLRQNSESSGFVNGKALPGSPGTPASIGSKSNSFQIPREQAVYPERAEGDTPGTYLAKLEEAVNRGVIAAILCKGFDEFSKTCFRKYMRGFSYFGDSIDMAVRKMLMQVELPKETQQIDRLLQGFADRYCECNPGIFVTTDEAYFVAFSILLLHSDTHNKSNKRKMQKADYVKNTQDQVEVSRDILECFYDNVSYTPFIHFEDEVAISSHRMAAPRPKKGLFKAPSNDNLRGPVDPYALILDQKLELLRPSLKDVMDTEDTYSCTGTVPCMDANGLYQAFHKAAVLQIVSARSRPDAFLLQATISNPAEAQAGLVDIKAAKVGLLWRKDPKKKKARSPWQEWGALLTGSQLYFFRDVAWIKNLMSQYEAHQKSGSDANPVVFKPPLSSFQPDALLSMDDAVALLDTGYKKHKHAFLFIKHGGFEEVFLANGEGDMNDWIAKLNYAATFRTAGVRMRGFIGANYEGQRPELCRNDSMTSTTSNHTAPGGVHTHGRQINQRLAGEILAYRRQIMTDKITEADDRLAAGQKELDNLIRNARHLQICSPIQAKTREALVLAAGRMSAKLKWTRVDMWRTRCYRDVMKMDLEQEIGLDSAASILRESMSLRSTPQKKTPLKLSNASMTKGDVKNGDAAASPKSAFSMLSSVSSPQAVFDKARLPDAIRHRLSDDYISRGQQLSIGSVEQSLAASDGAVEPRDRTSSFSTQSHTAQSLNHRPSISSSQLGRSDVDSIGHGSRLTTPTPSIDDEERILREANVPEFDRTSNTLRRPGTSESDRDFATTITSPDSLSKDRSGAARRSLHRTLRDSPQSHHQTPQSLRRRKGKEPPAVHHHHASPTASTTPRRTSQSGATSESLARGTGSFIVHGKKASVITFGSEWQTMSSNEERLRVRKLGQTDGKEVAAVATAPAAAARANERAVVMLSPKAEEEEEEEEEDNDCDDADGEEDARDGADGLTDKASEAGVLMVPGGEKGAQLEDSAIGLPCKDDGTTGVVGEGSGSGSNQEDLDKDDEVKPEAEPVVTQPDSPPRQKEAPNRSEFQHDEPAATPPTATTKVADHHQNISLGSSSSSDDLAHTTTRPQPQQQQVVRV
jgi:Sec7 domain